MTVREWLAENEQVRYLITFTCYGAHLHGEDGAIDRLHNTPGGPLPAADTNRVKDVMRLMDQAPYLFDLQRREIVLEAVREVCSHRAWSLWAAHVRTNHVHAVVEGGVKPEKCMNDFKTY